MPVRAKLCNVYGAANNIRAMACISCGESFRKRGRPRGTTRQAGYGRQYPEFHDAVELPTDWYHSNELVNIDDELLDACRTLNFTAAYL